MLPAYDDIRSRIAGPPAWHDQHGVPRYAAFTPEMVGVYDNFAVLVKIDCQRCSRQFFVGAGWTRFDVFADPVRERTLADCVATFDYGDPPRHDDGDMGRCAGETMSSGVVQVIQAWERTHLVWVRRAKHEGVSAR